MPWFIVTCRLADDDEDSLYVFDTTDVPAAIALAEDRIRDDADDDVDRDFFFNYVVECDTPPTVRLRNI